MSDDAAGALPERPLVIAHRGASAHAEENSLAAFSLARAQGADGIEFDVRFTGDGEVVVHHDAVVRRLGPLIEHSLAAARRVAPSLVTLPQVLEVAGEMMLDIEIKNDRRDPDYDEGHAMAAAVAAWIAANRLEPRALVSSFNAATMRRVRELAPGVATGLLVARGRDVAAGLQEAAAAGHAWVLPRYGAVRFRLRRITADAQGRGIAVGMWTVDRPGPLRKLGHAGVDAVITNDPGRALAVYE